MGRGDGTRERGDTGEDGSRERFSHLDTHACNLFHNDVLVPVKSLGGGIRRRNNYI